MRAFVSPTDTDPASNASAVAALRDRINTMSMQSPKSSSNAARSGSASKNESPAHTDPADTPNVAQMHAELTDLKDIVWKLIKSNNRLKDESASLKDDVLSLQEEASSTMDEISLLKGEISSLKDGLVRLREENRDILECQTALADLVASIQQQDSRPQQSNILSPPSFNRNAHRFYVIVQGRCPGVYSNLVWAKKLVNGLDPDHRMWRRVDGYQEARAYYEDAERMNEIKVTDRHFPDDASIYGPIPCDEISLDKVVTHGIVSNQTFNTSYLSFMQSNKHARSNSNGSNASQPESSQKKPRTTHSASVQLQRTTKVVTVRRKKDGRSSIKSNTVLLQSSAPTHTKQSGSQEPPINSCTDPKPPSNNPTLPVSPDLSPIEPIDPTTFQSAKESGESSASSKQKTSLKVKDKLTDWKANQRQQYMDELLRHEGPIDPKRLLKCADCECDFDETKSSPLRCMDCSDGYALRCKDCVLALHDNLPFHRIEKWQKTHFVKTSTHDLGLITILGHDGLTGCSNPSMPLNLHVLHTTGWHTIQVKYCCCSSSEAVSRDIQLFRAQMIAASSERIRTAFTFELMELFHELNLQSKITAYDFYHTMSNRTDPLKLRKQPSQLNNFLRVIRIWRHLFSLKRAGCGHNPEGVSATRPGETMIECPACPHPLKNLPSDWDTNTKLAYLYTLFVAVDANFKLKGKDKGLEDVELGPGWGAFVEENQYQDYISNYEAEPEINTCKSEHDAVLRANIRRTPGYSVTGAGLVICSRHCLVRPNGAGDLQKGERYCNMDYIIFSALAGLCLLRLVITYDIACQWSRNYRARMKTLPSNLQLPENISTRVAVPSWHINAHGKSCQQRFHVGYLHGVGRLCGDEVEQTWWITNVLGTSLREMAAAARHETLSDHWNALNFRKIVGFRKIFLKSLREAVEMCSIHRDNFTQFSESFSEQSVIKDWEKMVTEYEQDPETKPNPYEDTEIKITLHDVRLELGKEETARLKKEGLVQTHKVSMVGFLTKALELEDQQRELREHRSNLGSSPTPKQAADFQEKCMSLQRRILLWRDTQKAYMPSVNDLTDIMENEDSDGEVDVENIPLCLPSSLTPEQRVPINRIGNAESRLREAQLDEALGEICRLRRILSGVTAFKTHNLAGEGNKANTRIWSIYSRLNERISSAKRKYHAAYSALLVLDGNGAWRKTFHELRDEDIRGPGKDVDDSHGKHLVSWIWLTRRSKTSGTQEDAAGSSVDLLDEGLRVEWAQSRARSHRWEEEVQLLLEEMRRVVDYLTWKSAWWEKQASRRPDADEAVKAGLSSYAHKQASFHRLLAQSCQLYWTKEVTKLGLTVPFDNELEDSEHDAELSDDDL
ncbi:hypothetical protein CVT24_002657 [Panaeolus cyanescens]|uniref:CxC2-like cysteine cluster KDZ transposase-associated domain-containing protein n=1 Tax=Panaeolus cyanescens TaxID=181874 RepID=A0A409WPW4_9AGAR|nr:hypothetical protein CVT24_002657 [Panaeolus cyanescens]